MRIENVENQSLNWVSISSAGVLDMTHCVFSAKTARDGMRHIIGGSEPDVIIGSDKDQNRGCRKRDKDHLEFLCELYDNSRMACVVQNSDGGSVHVRSGRVRQGKTRFRQRERANDYQHETSSSTIAEQMHRCTSARPDQRE